MKGDLITMTIEQFKKLHPYDLENLNCGSFALGLNYWFNAVEIYIGEEIDTTEFAFEQIAITEILNSVDGIRELNQDEEPNDDEYLVLFRIGYTYTENKVLYRDFHFVIRDTDNRYYHKRGSLLRLRTMSESEVYSNKWCNMYNGTIYRFARKIKAD